MRSPSTPSGVSGTGSAEGGPVRRRITLAILGTVAVALLLTGLGTLVLDRLAARTETESELRSQARGLAEIVAPTVLNDGKLARPKVQAVIEGFQLEGIGFVFLGPGGNRFGELPPGIDGDLVDPTRLAAGETLSGREGRLVYAMAPTGAAKGTLVAVLTRRVDRAPGPGFRWFVVAAGAVLLLGTVVASRLSRAVAGPLGRAEVATQRIAEGDLATRLPVGPGDDDELARLARSINVMAERLERARLQERQFLLSVSHDLRTPLTAVRGYAEAIAEGKVPDLAAAGRVILGEAQRLERLVRDLIDLARLDARAFSLRSQVAPVAEVVREALDGFGREADDGGIELVVTDDGSDAQAFVDPDRLAQVVANLVENGIRFASTGVRVEITATNSIVAVAVLDDGAGIAPEDLPRVFERLYVARSGPERSRPASGLGLAIVEELVVAMGGSVEVSSPTSAAGGSRFVVSLPRVATTAGSDQGQQA